MSLSREVISCKCGELVIKSMEYVNCVCDSCKMRPFCAYSKKPCLNGETEVRISECKFKVLEKECVNKTKKLSDSLIEKHKDIVTFSNLKVGHYGNKCLEQEETARRFIINSYLIFVSQYEFWLNQLAFYGPKAKNTLRGILQNCGTTKIRKNGKNGHWMAFGKCFPSELRPFYEDIKKIEYGTYRHTFELYNSCNVCFIF